MCAAAADPRTVDQGPILALSHPGPARAITTPALKHKTPLSRLHPPRKGKVSSGEEFGGGQEKKKEKLPVC